MRAAAPRFLKTIPEPVRFDGGLDVMTPPLAVPPGYVRAAQNYEIAINGGYKTLTGYERFDGRPSPSAQSYATLPANINGAQAVGNTVTGATSGATGVICFIAPAPETYLVLCKLAGNFQNGENLQIGGITIAVCQGAQVVGGAPTALLNAQFTNAAAGIYRADIQAVPGSGPVRGVWQYNGTVYAVRNNAGGTAGVIYASSAGGWAAVTLYNELAFNTGAVSIPPEGATVTQGAVTATLKRVVLTSGSWAGGNAAGRLIVTNPVGGNFAAGAITFTGGATATAGGAQTAITINPGGRYEVYIENMGGALGTRRVYGCSGVDRGFEFDGLLYVPITTGMAPDTPSHVYIHKLQLFFAFGSSAQHSAIGFPYQWSAVFGAAELACGDTITGFIGQPGSTAGGALAIYTRNHIKMLYGSSAADWNLVGYAGENEQGGIAYSMQRITSNTLVMDDRGIAVMAATLIYGNFECATISNRVQSLMLQKRSLVTGSCLARDKNQYRLFFSDKSAVYLTFSGKQLRGIMPVLLNDDIYCIHESGMPDGTEVIFFGSSNGYVYQMEKGTSFDGADIESYIWLAWNASRSVRQRKRYKRAMFEVAGTGYAELNFSYQLAYNSADVAQPGYTNAPINFAPTYWDSFTWDSASWDGESLTPQVFSMEGSGENVSLILQSKSAYFSPVTVSGAVVHYVPRRLLRS